MQLLKTYDTPEKTQQPLALLEQELKARGFSHKTLRSYVFHSRHFLKFLGAHEDYSEADIKNYVAFLLANKSASYAHLALAAVKFLSKEIFDKDFSYIENPKREHTLPVVLTQTEMQVMLSCTSNPKHKMLLEFLYGCGLRVSEAVKIKTQDIDSR